METWFSPIPILLFCLNLQYLPITDLIDYTDISWNTRKLASLHIKVSVAVVMMINGSLEAFQ